MANTTGEFQFDVFLSYSAKDKAVVRPLAERLRQDGLRVWFDEWVLKPGDSIPAKIEEGLEHSRVLVLCMSANAFGSDWAQLEAGTFRFRDPLNKERRFIPLRLDDASIKGSLVQFLYLDWHKADREQEYARLLEASRYPAKWPQPANTRPSKAGTSPPRGKGERKGLRRQLISTVIVVVAAVGIIGILHLIPPKRFPANAPGILVLQLSGDENRTLQRELVSSLNAELASYESGKGIEVWAGDKSVDETKGLSEAHTEARKLGAKQNALLVIWGAKVGDTRFFPRITIVQSLTSEGDRTLTVKDIHELNLPPETVKQPIYIAHVIRACSLLIGQDFDKALSHFATAIRLSQATPEEGACLSLLSGVAHCMAAARSTNTAVHVEQAIRAFSSTTNYYRASGSVTNLAMATYDLGCAYLLLPSGDYDDNVKRSISAFQSALRIYTKEAFPVDWAMVQNALGFAYCELLSGDRVANLKAARDALQAALRVRTEKEHPLGWAQTQQNLSAVYLSLAKIKADGNVERALAACRASLTVFSEKASPVVWAGIMNNLGSAYAELSTGDRKENFKQAMEALQAAFRVRTQAGLPAGWAETQLNMGNVYHHAAVGDRVDNLTSAIASYEAALKVFNEKDYPLRWAMTQYNLGLVYTDFPEIGNVERLKQALACFEGAQRVLTEQSCPNEWAAAEHNLGTTFEKLAIYGDAHDRLGNANKAIAAFEQALHVWTEQGSPWEWAMVHNNLGAVYIQLLSEGNPDDLERAISALKAALRVRTKKDYPENWATTQNNLALVYAGNPETASQALDLLKEVLQVRTEQRFPADWAQTQFSMGVAYGNLPLGERSENIKQASNCFSNALRLWKPEQFPRQYHDATQCLAQAEAALKRLNGN